jgi:hypothetical protein
LSKNSFKNFKDFKVTNILNNSKCIVHELVSVNTEYLDSSTNKHNSEQNQLYNDKKDSSCNSNMLYVENVNTNIQTPIYVISDTCESAAASQDASGSHVAGHQGEDSSTGLVIAQVYAHNVGSSEGDEFIYHKNDKQGENYGVITGSINHSANREVLITNVFFTPGEEQSLGDGAQSQLNEERVTSLGNLGYLDGATMFHQPHDEEFNILDSYGVSKQVSGDYIICKETLDEEHPVGVDVIGGCPKGWTPSNIHRDPYLGSYLSMTCKYIKVREMRP